MRMIAIAFQSDFYSKMHQNNVFYFLKIIFSNDDVLNLQDSNSRSF
jgi:hypothetical protein